MKWYFAGRVRHQGKLVEVAKFLEATGESITSDWLYQGSLKPYEKNLDRVQVLGRKVVESLLETGVFVLISDPEGTDMFIELGVCLARKAGGESMEIYIIGDHSKRSLMQLHPDIIHLKNFKELFDMKGVNYRGFNFPVFD